MTRPFILDLETGARPLAEIEHLLPVIEPPSNWKDEAKRTAYVAEKREQLLRDAALDAVLSRVLAVGILRGDGPPQFITDDDEASLLRQTWHTLETREADETYVTFNGTKFDWPTLARRSFTCGVPVPRWLPLDGRWPARSHCDLLTLWQAGDRQEFVSLDRLSRMILGQGKSGDGANFAGLWATDRPAALDYLRQDLELTRALWHRMAGWGVSA